MRPKHHAHFGISRRAQWAGTPLTYSTYRDETLNGLIAGIAKSTHPRKFAARVLKRYWILRLVQAIAF